jgi:hypothetical protein
MVILKWIKLWIWFKRLRIGCSRDDFVSVGINCRFALLETGELAFDLTNCRVSLK